MLPEDAHAEVAADLDPDHEPLLPGYPGTPRHKVKGHDRILPPKEVQEDPHVIRFSDLYPDDGWPEPTPPQPRVIPVREHLRRNPRHKETTMPSEDVLRHEANSTFDAQRRGEEARADESTCLPPETRTDVTAMKDAAAVTALPERQAEARLTDPATSHEAAKVATLSLRRRMADVLQTFQWEATKTAKYPGAVEGLTDEDLQRCFTNYTFKGSPSGVRTARKDLCRAGLLEPKMIGEIEDTRPTALGNAAIVYVLTEAGAAFDLADQS